MTKKSLSILISLLTAAVLFLCPVLSRADAVTLPASLTEIGDEAFAGDTAITGVMLGNSILFIGDRAFSGCTGLGRAVISGSMLYIGDEAFSGCTGLSEVLIPGDDTALGEDAFDEDVLILCSAGSAAAVWAEENGRRWMPITEKYVFTQPQNISAAAGETVTFSFTARDASGYQWQVSRFGGPWTDTFLTGYDTSALSMEANLNRTVLKFRCRMTFTDGTVLYTGPAALTLTTLSADDIAVSADSKVIYAVPVYEQGNINMCWSVSMQMVEDWQTGALRTSAEAYLLSLKRHTDLGPRIYDIGYHPYDTHDYKLPAPENSYTEQYIERDMMTGAVTATPERLYQQLVMYGPSYLGYGFYSDWTLKREGGHSVLLTGIDLETGKVYTNNPWGISGSQTWDELQESYLIFDDTAVDESGVWELESVSSPNWVLWQGEVPVIPDEEGGQPGPENWLEYTLKDLPEDMQADLLAAMPEGPDDDALKEWVNSWIEEHIFDYIDDISFD